MCSGVQWGVTHWRWHCDKCYEMGGGGVEALSTFFCSAKCAYVFLSLFVFVLIFSSHVHTHLTLHLALNQNFPFIVEIVCQVVFPNLVWNVTSGDRWIMAPEATKLASTSRTDISDMSGPAGGGERGGSRITQQWFSKILGFWNWLCPIHIWHHEHWAYNW